MLFGRTRNPWALPARISSFAVTGTPKFCLAGPQIRSWITDIDLFWYSAKELNMNFMLYKRDNNLLLYGYLMFFFFLKVHVSNQTKSLKKPSNQPNQPNV